MANNNGNKWGRMETEMDRFEAEISSLSKTNAGPQLPPGVGGGSSTSTAHSFLPASLRKQPQQQLPQSSSMLRPTLLKPSVIISGAPQVYGSPATLGLRPTQLLPKSVRPVGTPPSQITGSPINHHSLHNSPVQAGGGSGSLESSPFHPHPPPPSALQSPTSSSGTTPTSSQAASSSSATNNKSSSPKKKKKKTQKSGSGEGGSSKPKKVLRAAGGTVWEDPTLMDWDPKDFRLFCGDLGNDVTDEVLTRVFGRYPSFVKAKVVRDKRTNKTRGYGFVSFKDPNDFVRAMRELDGRYVGSRPIKLRKSTWDARSLTQVRKREKHQKQLLGLIKP